MRWRKIIFLLTDRRKTTVTKEKPISRRATRGILPSGVTNRGKKERNPE
ncbi:hypothetical protein [Brevibacillus reuszeri]|nr:hypothetical protein [Brevibacillus reuszeri]